MVRSVDVNKLQGPRVVVVVVLVRRRAANELALLIQCRQKCPPKVRLGGGGILELSVEFGLFDLIGSLSACGI